MIRLENFNQLDFKVSNRKLGLIVGGATPNTGSGSEVLAEGTPSETTISWSSDTETYYEDGSLEGGTYHRGCTTNDPCA